MAISKTKYAFAVGRVRVLETRLLDKVKFNRMLEAPSAEEAFKVLAESSYYDCFDDSVEIRDFETILQKETARMLSEFEKMSPEPELVALMALNYDFHNLKVLFKNKYLGVENNDILSPAGTIPLDRLKSAVETSKFWGLPAPLRQAGDNIIVEFMISRDPQLIDLNLDQALFAMRLGVAKKARSDFLIGFFQSQIDLLNINIFLRIKVMDRSREFLKQALVPGGLVDENLFIDCLDEGLDAITGGLMTSSYQEVAEEGFRAWRETGTASYLEKLSDDYITAYLQPGKYSPFGLEPLIGYLWGKQMEIKNIRLILVGKINGLPVDAIRERLRNVYL